MKALLTFFVLTFFVLSAGAQNFGVIDIPAGSGQGGGMDSIQVAILRHTENDGVDYPTIPDTVVWKARIINTEVVDEIGVTISGDTSVTLPAGKYLLTYYTVGPSNTLHRVNMRLYDITGGETISTGLNRVNSLWVGSGYYNGPGTISIQYWLDNIGDDWAADFFGKAKVSPDDFEVYSEITIIKLL